MDAVAGMCTKAMPGTVMMSPTCQAAEMAQRL
jgi:hypothetical protein